MIKTLCAAWRGRRVILIGGRADVCAPLEAWLTLLGARPAHLPPDASPEALSRALTDGRVAAVLVSAPPPSPILLREVREAGVPLLLPCEGDDGQDAALGALIAGAAALVDGP